LDKATWDCTGVLHNMADMKRAGKLITEHIFIIAAMFVFKLSFTFLNV